MQTHVPEIVYILFTVVTAIGVLLQALVLLGIFLSVRKSFHKMQQFAERTEEKLGPILSSTQHLVEDLSPKLRVTADNLLEASHLLRHQANHASETVDEILNLTQAQAERMNEMMTGTLNTVVDASAAVQSAVSTPLRHVAGAVNGLKAFFDVMRKKQPEAHAAADGDHFV
ncbi:hypothetical protein [Paracidobacterium acidisoli]|uniref:DUF948 domain-containing protein n=1 Tax=Paracidobacterium acidisoli TaxID=2303751 RepID=A0A372IJ39_9BACT|nr:hypothetical protein [Paracidobacterium acidisoli]MBT9333156.1 hypothetical protein [Paracidobacterium acidisoli]